MRDLFMQFVKDTTIKVGEDLKFIFSPYTIFMVLFLYPFFALAIFLFIQAVLISVERGVPLLYLCLGIAIPSTFMFVRPKIEEYFEILRKSKGGTN